MTDDVNKNVDQLLKQSIGNASEVSKGAMEIWQKNIALGASVFNMWANTLNTAQSSLGNIVAHSQKITEEIQRQQNAA